MNRSDNRINRTSDRRRPREDMYSRDGRKIERGRASGGSQSGNPNIRPGESSRRKRQQKKRQQDLIKKLLIGIAGVLVLILIINISARISVSKMLPEDKIANNIYIDGVDVSGMTKQEAISAMEKHLTELEETVFTFRTEEGSTEIPLKDFGLHTEKGGFDTYVDEAFSYGREGNIFNRKKALKKLKKQSYSIPVNYTIDETYAKNILNERCKIVNGAAVDAKYVFDGSTYQIQEGQRGKSVDVNGTLANVTQALASGWDGKPQNIQVVTVESDPAITSATLNEMPDCLGSFSTEYGSDNQGRNQNVENGVSHVSGNILQPGEEFSINAVMEPYTIENGYTEAGSYEDGQIVQTLGGGICQVSTTLYNALLYAELEIVHREEHSMTVSYVDAGRDAAIADDVKDLVFKNNLSYPIYILGYCDGTTVTFSIFGKETRTPGRTIELYSKINSTEEYETQYIEDDSLSAGEEEVRSQGRVGCDATLYRYIYQDGELIKSEEINHSYYSPGNTIIARGTGSGSNSDDENNDSDDESDSDEEDQ